MRTFLLIILLALLTSINAQVIYPYRTCTSPRELVEFSGIAKIDKNLLVGVNDGGDSPTLYFMDTTGKLLRKRTFKSIKNIDWEELCYSNGILNICDVGDNLCNRKELVIHHYDVKKDTVIGSKHIHFREKEIPLPKSKKDFDCEAAMALGDKIWLFSKTHANPYTGKCYQYELYKSDKISGIKAVDSTSFGTRGFIYNSITGAAISPKNIVALISCTHVWFKFMVLDDKSFFKNISLDFDFDGITQKEAITFLSDYQFVVADERTAKMMGGRLYFFDLKPFLNGNKKYTKPKINTASVKRTQSKKGEFDFTFDVSLTKPAKKLTWFLVDKEGNILLSHEMSLSKTSKHETSSWNQNESNKVVKACAFWIIDGNQVIFIDKIKFR